MTRSPRSGRKPCQADPRVADLGRSARRGHHPGAPPRIPEPRPGFGAKPRNVRCLTLYAVGTRSWRRFGGALVWLAASGSSVIAFYYALSLDGRERLFWLFLALVVALAVVYTSWPWVSSMVSREVHLRDIERKHEDALAVAARYQSDNDELQAKVDRLKSQVASHKRAAFTLGGQVTVGKLLASGLDVSLDSKSWRIIDGEMKISAEYAGDTPPLLGVWQVCHIGFPDQLADVQVESLDDEVKRSCLE